MTLETKKVKLNKSWSILSLFCSFRANVLNPFVFCLSLFSVENPSGHTCQDRPGQILKFQVFVRDQIVLNKGNEGPKIATACKKVASMKKSYLFRILNEYFFSCKI
jgi:hypothetical protein